jgi:hypothetical protein
MTTNHHDPIVFRSPADAETFNAPMAQLDEELTAQASAIGTANSNIGTLQGQMSTANSNIGTLQGQMSTANSNIGTLQGQMTTANSNIGTLQGQMSTAQGDISTLQSQIAAATAPVAFCGRLTLVSGNPEPGPVSDADTIYFTPYKGNLSVLWDSPSLKTVQFAELALSLDYGPGIEQGSIYDVYLVDDAGTLRIGFGPAWASPTSRGTGAASAEITLKDGIWVNANEMYLTCGLTHAPVTVNAFKATLLGSFVAVDGGQGSPTGDGKTSDDETLGYLYNVYNQVEKENHVYVIDDHFYNSYAWRNWGGTESTKLELLLGLPKQTIFAQLRGNWSDNPGDFALDIDYPNSNLFMKHTIEEYTYVSAKHACGLGRATVIAKQRTTTSTDHYDIDVWLFALR